MYFDSTLHSSTVDEKERGEGSTITNNYCVRVAKHHTKDRNGTKKQKYSQVRNTLHVLQLDINIFSSKIHIYVVF